MNFEALAFCLLFRIILVYKVKAVAYYGEPNLL